VPDGSPFVEDPGPGFDAEQAAAGAEQVRQEHEAEARAEGIESFGIPDVEEPKVRHALFVAGDGLHAAFGVGEYDWLMTQRDLDRIAPPLTRIINRYEAAKIVAGFSDEAAVVMGVGLWGWRSVLERVAVIRAQERGETPSMGPTRAPRPEAPAPAARPAPGPETPAPAWPSDAPPAPQASPAPAPPASPPGGAGGEPFPGAGAPRDPTPVPVEVVGGYVTHADRIRQARERRPVAVPYQTQAASH
jgi:hypothetical protein